MSWTVGPTRCCDLAGRPTGRAGVTVPIRVMWESDRPTRNPDDVRPERSPRAPQALDAASTVAATRSRWSRSERSSTWR